MRFTKPAIEALKKRAERYEVWEDGRTGLGIRVSERGRKTWVLLYRFDGRARRLTLGTYPAMSLAQAHTRVGEAREALERGEDPGTAHVAHRRAERAAETVSQLIDEYLEHHAGKHKKASSAAEDKRMLDRSVRPELGHRKARSITRRDLILLLDKIEARGSPVSRNRHAAVLGKMFRFAVQRGVIDTSPAVDIPRLPEAARERVLSAEEIRTFWLELDRANMAPVSRLGLRFLLATAQRRGEVAGARRDEIDSSGDVWEIPAERTKNGRAHKVPLSPLAKSLLAEIDALRLSEAERHASAKTVKTVKTPFDFLLPSPLGTGAITSAALTRAMLNNRTSLGLSDPDDPARLHDLRRTAATVMTQLGISQEIVGRVLNHSERTVTGRHYDKNEYLPEKRRALEAWGAWLEDVIAGRNAGTNVVRLLVGV